jgi:DNA-binding transcriptional ArsR family regulator
LVVSRAASPSTPADDTCQAGHAHDVHALKDVRRRLIDPRAVDEVAEVFKLLGDPTRVRIVDALSYGERCVCDLADLVGMSESAVSHQLRLLRATRLVRVRRAGRQAFYSLDDHHVLGLLHDARTHAGEGKTR